MTTLSKVVPVDQRQARATSIASSLHDDTGPPPLETSTPKSTLLAQADLTTVQLVDCL